VVVVPVSLLFYDFFYILLFPPLSWRTKSGNGWSRERVTLSILIFPPVILISAKQQPPLDSTRHKFNLQLVLFQNPVHCTCTNSNSEPFHSLTIPIIIYFPMNFCPTLYTLAYFMTWLFSLNWMPRTAFVRSVERQALSF
jgi:hypothetical protein